MHLSRWVIRDTRVLRLHAHARAGDLLSGSLLSRARVEHTLTAHLELVDLLLAREFASLLEAGLPLEQAFSALLEQAERPYLRDLIASIRSEVIGGAAFSDVLARHPRAL